MADSELYQKGAQIRRQLLGYVGAPLIREAILTAKRVYAEMKSK